MEAALHPPLLLPLTGIQISFSGRHVKGGLHRSETAERPRSSSTRPLKPPFVNASIKRCQQKSWKKTAVNPPLAITRRKLKKKNKQKKLPSIDFQHNGRLICTPEVTKAASSRPCKAISSGLRIPAGLELCFDRGDDGAGVLVPLPCQRDASFRCIPTSARTGWGRGVTCPPLFPS